MTSSPALTPGERVVRTWPARSPGSTAGRSVSGDLVLTNHRLLFVPKAGFFGGSRTAGAGRSVPLEEIGGAAPHRTEMRIGYGDRMTIEGVVVGGESYELGRDQPARLILGEIAAARRARRREVGLPEDLADCRSCGRWVSTGQPLCTICAANREVLS